MITKYVIKGTWFKSHATSDIAPFGRELHRTWLLFGVSYIGHGSFFM